MIWKEIVDPGTSALDYTLFRSVNGLAGRSGALDAVMIASAKYLPLVFAAALVGFWISWRPRNQLAAFLAGVSALIALGIGQVMGKLLPRPPPHVGHRTT